MKLEPLFDRVLIKVNPSTQSKYGDLVLPDDDSKQVIEGTIISVGDGLPDEPMQLKAGYMVMIQKFSGIKTTIDNEDYIICKQRDVLCRKVID